jgi:hypothetical protein
LSWLRARMLRGLMSIHWYCRLWRARRQAQPIARCALAQGKTQLAGLPLRTLCGVPWAAKRTGPPVPARPVRIPFLRTVYSVVQFRNPRTNTGDIAGFQLHVMLHTQGVNTMRFHSLRTAVLFGLVALALMANGKKPIAAAQLAPPASPSVALSASPASAQAGQQVTLTWSSTNATSITLEPSVGSVAAQGSTTVRPSQSTTYTVTATGPGGSAHASAQVVITPAPPQAAVRKPSPEDIPSDQQQMRGLDEQIQEIKSDALRMSAELSQLEEKLLYPSGTQVAIFVALAKGDTMRLDAVRLQIDGQLVAHYIYSAKELQALRKGGVQRIYVGNVATGNHKLEVLVDGKLEGGADFSRTGEFTFRKEVKPKLVGLTVAGPRSGNTPIALGEW